MSSFSGRTAVVTGAGGGGMGGLAIAVDLAARGGARVVAVDVKEAPTELPDGVTFCRGDISDSGSRQRS